MHVHTLSMITYSMTLMFKIDCTKQTVWQAYKLQLNTVLNMFNCWRIWTIHIVH